MFKFSKDFKEGEEGEIRITKSLEELGRNVIKQPGNSILDFKLIDKKGREVWVEAKTRKCNKNDYPDTMIGLNKLIEAYKRYDLEGLYTLFIFQYKDGIYWVNPFFVLPRFDYLQGRFDRGGFDKKKGYIYYPTDKLNSLSEN